MPSETCKLCHKVAELQVSHLLPKAAYRYMRSTTPGNEDPIMGRFVPNGPQVMLQSSKQIAEYALCSECELLLSVNGEEWVLSNLAVGEASPLYYSISSLPPILDDRGFKVYSTEHLPEFDTNRVAHFALGVFFKAGARSWMVGLQKRRLILGPYLEPIRKFLLGQADFPDRCSLMFCLFPPSNLPKSLCFPYRWNGGGCHTYSFCLIGLEFVLSLGKQISEEFLDHCFVRKPNRPVLVTDLTQQNINAMSMEILRKGNVKGKLANKLLPPC